MTRAHTRSTRLGRLALLCPPSFDSFSPRSLRAERGIGGQIVRGCRRRWPVSTRSERNYRTPAEYKQQHKSRQASHCTTNRPAPAQVPHPVTPVPVWPECNAFPAAPRDHPNTRTVRAPSLKWMKFLRLRDPEQTPGSHRWRGGARARPGGGQRRSVYSQAEQLTGALELVGRLCVHTGVSAFASRRRSDAPRRRVG